MVKEIYRSRIKALTDIWSQILANPAGLSREDLPLLIQKVYEENNIKPFRGFKTENLFDKEIISLYVVGKDGLGFFEEYKTVFERLFSDELTYDEALNLIINKKPIEAFELLNKNKEKLARVLRLAFTRVVFSFADEQLLINALRELHSTNVDEMQHTAESFARFYTAFKLAEGIVEGTIKSKLDYEAQKRAISITIGIKYPLPKQSYVSLIVEEVFNTKPSKKIFSKKSTLSKVKRKV
ncbi:MAG: DUF2192 domain-containing protein [Sulfolobaceae archaeon]|nr:DUF2192 domain-containing protein [Sulfolobaceae archaeon]